VRFEVDGGVGTLTLDRPGERNVMTPATWGALAAVGRALPEDVRVVVVRGAGTSFCAGLDLRVLSPRGNSGDTSILDVLALDDAGLDAAIAEWQDGFTWLRQPDIVSVAAVQGHAVGAGFQLALSCDLRVLADDAKFSMREPALGLVPDLTGTKPLVECVGYSRALEICATTRWVEAEEAVRIGLASLVVPRADLAGAVSDLVAALLAAPRSAVSATKELLLGAAARDLDAQRAAERRRQVPLLRSLQRTLVPPDARP
jgi:enoyl-CoA hydratase/carnithine racemase